MSKHNRHDWSKLSPAAKDAHMNALSSETKTEVPDVPRETPTPGKPDTYPPNLFSGMQKRLDFDGKKPGFAYRWFNDTSANVRDALRSGWVLVDNTQAQLHDAVTPLNTDVGSHVTQHVGTNAAGGPMIAYLMEKPEWLVKEHESGPGSREEYHKSLETQIRAGTLAEKAGENRYNRSDPTWGGQSALPRISVDRKLAR